jgi:hypothetical protein
VGSDYVNTTKRQRQSGLNHTFPGQRCKFLV